MTISDERLAELIEYFDQYAVNEVDETIREESLGALRELQAARELLGTLAAQWSGEIGSTKRSDCMAVLARVHLREYGQAHD